MLILPPDLPAPNGTDHLLYEVVLEMGHFRDIIFHFKHSIFCEAIASSTDVSDDFTWLPHHTTLKWTTKGSKPIYSVATFCSANNMTQFDSFCA